MGLGGGDLLDLERKRGRESFCCWWWRSEEVEQGESFSSFFPRAFCFFAFLSLFGFFHEPISSRSRPFRPRSARPRTRTRSKRPRGGGGTPAKALNSAPLSSDSTNKPTEEALSWLISKKSKSRKRRGLALGNSVPQTRLRAPFRGLPDLLLLFRFALMRPFNQMVLLIRRRGENKVGKAANAACLAITFFLF